MYCCGDPKPLTVSGETFCKLGVDMKGYVYKSMWAGPPNYDGVYDVDDSVTGIVRTEGPVITLHGAWAQNIFEDAMYIDFMGSKGGIRLRYGEDFTYYTAENNELVKVTPRFRQKTFSGRNRRLPSLHQNRRKTTFSYRYQYHHGENDAGHLRFRRCT
jgi:predicted dehydrogenase